MRKKLYKILTTLIILIVGIHSICVAAPAAGTDGAGGAGSPSFGLDKIMQDADRFLDASDGENKFTTDTSQEMIKSVYSVFLTIGIIVAVIIGIVLSIKFIVGSVEDQAQVKEMLIPYVVGCVVVFGAFTIWSTVVNILQSS